VLEGRALAEEGTSVGEVISDAFCLPPDPAENTSSFYHSVFFFQHELTYANTRLIFVRQQQEKGADYSEDGRSNNGAIYTVHHHQDEGVEKETEVFHYTACATRE